MRLFLPSRPSGQLLGAISVIAVGVGLAAMVFALADPALRNPPYAHPDRLVSISFGLPPPGPAPNPADVPSLAEFQAHTDLFVGVAAFVDEGWLRVRLSDRVLPLRAVAVTDNLLDVLGLQSRFAESDPAGVWVTSHVAALSGGELQPGRSVSIVPEGALHVESVLPDSFLLPEANRIEPADALVVRPVGPVIKIDGKSSQALDVVARIRAGVTRQMIEAALNVDMAPIGRRVSVVSLSMALNSRLRGLALGALLASTLVVLVCWTNVFSMAVTHGLYRAPEIATRTALGATSSRIARLLGGEALKVVVFGSVSALAVTRLALAAALRALPPQFATLGAPSMTTRVALFVGISGAVSGMSWWVASVLAWKLGAKRQALHVLSRDGRTIRIVRFVLTAGQLAATSMLLVASTLLGRSYLNLMNVDSGLDDDTQTMTVSHDPNIPLALRRGVVERTLMAFRSARGVLAAGASAGSLLDGRATGGGVRIAGHWQVFPPPDLTFVVGDYFKAVGLQFLAGGPPDPSDAEAAVITESAAREFFGGRLPIGDVIFRDRDLRIVGVVRDVRSRRLSVPPRPGIYEQADGWNGAQAETTYVLRVADSSVPTISWERIVRGVDPLAVVLDAGSIRERLDRSVRDRTFATLVIGLFALSSLLVVALGLAGVVAYTVVKRTREIAIRLVLGATVEGVTTLVVRDALTAATCGVAGGVMASVWLSRALESFLYGIHAADPITLVSTAASLLVVVLAVATLPGIRAGRITPASALRIE